MHLLDLTLPSAAENLALDEALIEVAERGEGPRRALRLWEPREPMVVVGRSSHVSAEVHQAACDRRGVHVLRRVSGGAAIVTGPGCLMYALVLSYDERPQLKVVSEAHRHVLGTMQQALGGLCPDVERQGTSDLAIGPMKFSGNSVRCRRNHLLYHGTLLYDFDLTLVEQCLAEPQRQPDYRERRRHSRFVTNFPADAVALRKAICSAWQADEPYEPWPAAHVEQLVREKYSQPDWNLKH